MFFWGKIRYIVIADVIVPENDTLIIEPGVEVKFQPEDERLKIIVYGCLLANGTEDDSIYFTSNSDEPQSFDWRCVRVIGGRIEVSYADFSYMATGVNLHDCISAEIEHCKFYEYGLDIARVADLGTIPDAGGVWGAGDTIIISDCTVTKGYYRSIGIAIGVNDDDNLEIANCHIDSVEMYGILVSQSRLIENEVRISIRNSSISNCDIGIEAEGYKWDAFSIIGCDIHDCTNKGIHVLARYHNLEIKNNDIYNIIKRGLHIDNNGAESNDLIHVKNNRIHHCLYGVFATLGDSFHDVNPTFEFLFNTVAFNMIPIVSTSPVSIIRNNIFALNNCEILGFPSNVERNFQDYNHFWNRWEEAPGYYPPQVNFRLNTHDIFANPMFISDYNLHLRRDSPAIDKADPEVNVGNEPENNGDRANLGGYGTTNEATETIMRLRRPILAAYPRVMLFNLTSTDERDSVGFVLGNFGDGSIRIESIEISDDENFNIDEIEEFQLEPMEKTEDTLYVRFTPRIARNFFEILIIRTDYEEVLIPLEARSTGFTRLRGDLPGILTKENSPYIVEWYQRIEDDDSLIIEPGVKLMFCKYRSLDCRGTLIARGLPNDSIIFTSFEVNPDKNDWLGITCGGSTFIDYAVVEYTGNYPYDSYPALNVASGNESDSIVISNISIRKNTGDGLVVSTGDAFTSIHHVTCSECYYGFRIGDHGEVQNADVHHITAVNNSLGISISLDSVATDPILENSISAYNVRGFRYRNGNNNDTKIIRYCNVFGNEFNGGYVFEDCNFEDPQLIGSPHYPYWLSDDSPCIDAGNPDAETDPDSTRTDLGAVPFNQENTPPEIDRFTPENRVCNGITGIPITFRVEADDQDENILDFQWTVGDSVVFAGDSIQWTFWDPGEYDVAVSAVDGYEWSEGVNWLISIDQNSIKDNNLVIPEDFNIISIFPNPFNSVLNLTFTIPDDGDIIIKLYDVLGRRVYNSKKYQIHPGPYTEVIDLSKNASGVYIITVQHGRQILKRKLVLIR